MVYNISDRIAHYRHPLRGIWRGVRRMALLVTLPAALAGMPWTAARAAEPADLGALAGKSASVVIYHRFGEDRYPATNTTLEQLDAHIEEYTSGKYYVMPLDAIMVAIRQNRPLPDRTVAITIDDAYLSVFTEAWPRFRKAGLPFTVFVATEPVSDGLPGYMSWDQIRALRDAGVTIGAHSHSHLHMVEATIEADRADLEASNRIFERELGKIPSLFAYPYGEADLKIMKMVEKLGHEAAFGQHSGAFDASLPRYYLPRFPLNEAYGSIDRLRLALNALPLPVSDVTPVDPLVPPDGNPPAFGFTLAKWLGKAGRLACYHSHGGKAALERIGGRRVEVRFGAAFPKGRSRVNCTLPGPDGRWYWYGTQFYVKQR